MATNTWFEHTTEIPLERIIQTNLHRICDAFLMTDAAKPDYGLTLDDLVFMTGLEKNSITGPRLKLEKMGLIRKIGERRWNRRKTRTQGIYRLVKE